MRVSIPPCSVTNPLNGQVSGTLHPIVTESQSIPLRGRHMIQAQPIISLTP